MRRWRRKRKRWMYTALAQRICKEVGTSPGKLGCTWGSALFDTRMELWARPSACSRTVHGQPTGGPQTRRWASYPVGSGWPRSSALSPLIDILGFFVKKDHNALTHNHCFPWLWPQMESSPLECLILIGSAFPQDTPFCFRFCNSAVLGRGTALTFGRGAGSSFLII